MRMCTCEARYDRAHGESESLRELLVAETLQVTQHEDRSELRAESLQALVDVLAELTDLRMFDRAGGRIAGLIGHQHGAQAGCLAPGAPLDLPLMIYAAVYDDAKHPGAEERVEAKAADLAKKKAESVLNHIQSVTGCARHPEGNRVRTIAIPDIQLFEGGLKGILLDELTSPD